MAPSTNSDDKRPPPPTLRDRRRAARRGNIIAMKAPDGRNGLPGFEDLRRVHPWTRWRVHNDLSADLLSLFTVQARPAYDALVTSGVHRQTPENAEAEFAEAYAWMREQMSHQLPTTGGEPIWLWARTTWRGLARQMRQDDGREKVLLEVHLPRDIVLLSSFDDWHFPLNRMLHVPRRPDELTNDEAWWARAEPLLDEFDHRVDAGSVVRGTSTHQDYPGDLRRELETSWVHVFDPATWVPGAAIQATTHELRAEQIVRAIRSG